MSVLADLKTFTSRRLWNWTYSMRLMPLAISNYHTCGTKQVGYDTDVPKSTWYRSLCMVWSLWLSWGLWTHVSRSFRTAIDKWMKILLDRQELPNMCPSLRELCPKFVKMDVSADVIRIHKSRSVPQTRSSSKTIGLQDLHTSDMIHLEKVTLSSSHTPFEAVSNWKYISFLQMSPNVFWEADKWNFILVPNQN